MQTQTLSPTLGRPTRAKNGLKSLLLGALLTASALLIPAMAQAATFVVTNVADTNDGVCDADCSLREAVTNANATTGATASNPNAITFDPTVFGSAQSLASRTISVATLLPAITVPLTVTGSAGGVVVRSTSRGFDVFTVNSGVSASFDRLTISNGRTSINNSGTTTVTNSTLSGNSFGIRNPDGTLTITNSTVTGNQNDGIFSIRGTLNVSNSTVSGNNNGIFNSTNNTATITNVTLSSNRNATINNEFGIAVTLRNSLLVSTGTLVRGSFTDGGGNLLVSGTASDAKLSATLADNGGPTQTLALLADSPAIDAGVNANVPSGVTTDQRGPGYARITGGTVDIGAFEFGSMPPPNQAPTLDPTIKPSAPGPNDLVITDPRATDPEGDALSFTFEFFLDGTKVAATDQSKPNRLDLTQYPNLAVPGAVLTVTFTAFDGTNTVSVTRAVTIAAPPVANPASGSAMAGVQSVIGPVTGSDPNGLALRYVLLTQPTSGSAFLAGSANNVQLYYTSARGFSGADSVTFQVVNSEGRRSLPATISITVAGNGAPTAGNDSMTVKAGVRAEVPLTASDPNGGKLRYRITTKPTNGSAFLANNSSGGVSLFYTGNPTYSGADSVQFTVTDAAGATATGTISLTVVGNSAPTADNTTLDAISGQRASVLLSGNDADGDALVRYRITKQPSNGSAFLAGSGNNVQLFYTSNAGYVGSDSAQFTVTDSTGRASAPATVSINVSPAPNAAKNSGGNS